MNTHKVKWGKVPDLSERGNFENYVKAKIIRSNLIKYKIENGLTMSASMFDIYREGWFNKL